MDCYQIHETVIRDVVDVLVDVSKSVELGGIDGIRNRGKSFKSISAASSNLTLVFPVITSKNISIENASMITKAVERKAASMLQILFSAICISDSDNAVDYVKQFHQNLKLDSDVTVDAFMDAMDKFIIQNESNTNFTYDKELYTAIREDMKNISYVLPDNISESGINAFSVYPQYKFGSSSIVKETKNDSYEDAKNISSAIKNVNDMFKNQIVSSDVNKANELVPTTMIINFVSMSGETSIPITCIIGIKAKMYPIDSEDIINRIIIKNQDNNGFQKFIRASTREISFFKDFIFAIDRAKLDALSSSKKGSSSKLWKVLERRALKGKIRRTLGQINDATSITTLVVSQEEVEYLKKSENINIENPKVIRGIMESYGLMSFVIVDESMEVAKFIFDTGEDIYENLAFNYLEREASDNSYKKVINLMTKMNR
ncbi:MAG: hypothetical protein M0P49_00420 [Bacilli bacterium]|nr:hypothetical protein [Bacilli bacterium]